MRSSRGPRWTWMVLSAVVFVTAGAALLEIQALTRGALEQSSAVSELTLQQTKQVILARLQSSTETTDVDETKRRWRQLIAQDPAIAGFLETTTARGPGFVEISVAADTQQVIASSNRSRIGDAMPERRALTSIRDAGAAARWNAIFGGNADFESRLPLALAGDTKPLFTLQVLVSPVLLRSTLGPVVRRIVLGAVTVITLAILLAWLAVRTQAKQLRRVAGLIDRATRQDTTAGLPAADDTHPAMPEMSAIESKLNLLGQEYRGAMRAAADLRAGVGAMLEQMEEAIYLFDAESRLLMSGGPAGRFLGTTTPPAPGTALRTIWQPDTPAGDLLLSEVRNRTAFHDREVHCDLSSGPGGRLLLMSLDWSGDQFVVRIRDADGSRKVQNQLDLFTRLDAINRLTAGVAHEIKNPLNSIAARVGLMEAMLDETQSEMRAEVEIVAHEVERLDRVVRTFLDFTSPMEMSKEEFAVADLLSEIAGLIRPDGHSRGVTVHFTNRAVSSHVSGNRDLLKQALLNIAVNGMEAMPGGGALDIEVFQEGRECVVEIVDTGPGIPAGLRSKIFQLYFTTKERGSGIGLAMTFKTVQLHGGSVEFISQPGKGTRFQVRLPEGKP